MATTIRVTAMTPDTARKPPPNPNPAVPPLPTRRLRSLTDIAAPTPDVADIHDPDAGESHGLSHVTSTGISNEKLAMWTFLGSECLLFGGLISTYLLYKDKAVTGPLPKDL